MRAKLQNTETLILTLAIVGFGMRQSPSVVDQTQMQIHVIFPKERCILFLHPLESVLGLYLFSSTGSGVGDANLSHD